MEQRTTKRIPVIAERRLLLDVIEQGNKTGHVTG